MGKKLNTEIFVSKSQETHGDLYDYTKTIYIKTTVLLEIICRKHGSFWQRPYDHIYGAGCSKCKREEHSARIKKDIREYITLSIQKYKGFFNYDEADLSKGITQKIKIKCPLHGYFYQSIVDHYRMYQHGCPKCAPNYSYTSQEWISIVKKKHNGFYDYSLSIYKGWQSSVIIICPIHGKFTQKAYDHSQGCGCPMCKFSKGEKKICSILDEFTIPYETQVKVIFKDQIFRFDFFIPLKNLFIEFDGLYHYEPHRKSYNKEKMKVEFDKQKQRDHQKDMYCKVHNFQLLRIPYWEFDNIHTILNKYIYE